MGKPNLRRQSRSAIAGPIKLSWHDPVQGLVYLRGRCIDASATGMRIELTEPIPKRASIAVSAERIGYSGSASVKHVTRVGTKFVLGLELSQAIPAAMLQKHLVVAPSAEPKPAQNAATSEKTEKQEVA